MKKKDIVTVLKRKFIDINTSADQMKKIRELYKEVKDLPIADYDEIPKHLELKYRTIR